MDIAKIKELYPFDWEERILKQKPNQSIMDTQLVGHQLASLIETERSTAGRRELAIILMRSLGLYYRELKGLKIKMPTQEWERTAHMEALKIMFRLNPAGAIPMDYVSELMGQVSFHKDPEQDIATAESIASNEYVSIQVLLDTIAGEIQLPKYQRSFAAFRRKLPKNLFFAHLFLTHP